MSEIAIKKISELLGEQFLVPSYQRGYKWTEKQVTDLLNDIETFSKKTGKEEDAWYCLQPVVVKQKNNQWEVIDGQQRLTTIYLILNYINQGYAESRRKELFSLEYETRKGSKEFLEKLNGEINEENIDFFYISTAHNIISEWFNSKGQVFDLNKFESDFLHHTKVIWYETNSDDTSTEIFTRLNSGKIPLTNAELVKSLFLNSSNFKEEAENLRLKQLEIAQEWDRIEYTLQDDAFWYFINKDGNDFPTRIEFILNLISGKGKKDDEFFTFCHFSDKFQAKNQQEVEENWAEIKKYFQILEEWFKDRESYHKIGYLIATGTASINEIIKAAEGKTKTEFKKWISDAIKSKFNGVDLEELGYGDKNTRNILLLHNIQTILNNANETNRFPFDRYKKEKWDIEHISAVRENEPGSEKHQEQWLSEAKKYISEEKWQEIEKLSEFGEKYNKIFEFLEDDFEKNSISNLTLLDASTNRSYKNAFFIVKRNVIIDREKQGTFIPICTKNVFMKFYSKTVEQMNFYSKEDAESYLEDIKNTLKEYLN